MSERAAKKKATKKASKPKAARKKSEPKQEAQGAEAPAPATKLGPSPQAAVLSRHEGEMQERHSKGFSFGELAAVGLTRVLALGLGVPVDIRRRSTLEGNVSALKGWYKPAPKKERDPAPSKKAAKPAKDPSRKPKKE